MGRNVRPWGEMSVGRKVHKFLLLIQSAYCGNVDKSTVSSINPVLNTLLSSHKNYERLLCMIIITIVNFCPLTSLTAVYCT